MMDNQLVHLLQIYVFSESPFETVTAQVFSSSFKSSSVKFTGQVYSSSLPPLCNCHTQQNMYWLIYVWSENPFKTVIFITALHCVMWCKFKVFVVVFVVLMISCCCCVCRITHEQQQQAEQQQQQQQQKLRIKRFM